MEGLLVMVTGAAPVLLILRHVFLTLRPPGRNGGLSRPGMTARRRLSSVLGTHRP